MPNPTAHADDMKSPAQHETMPSLWWLEPWTFAVQQWNARSQFYRFWHDAKADRNDFLRQVEVTLKPACPHLYEDTIGYVQWAADEIKGLRASLSVMTEDRDAYVAKVESLRKEIESLRAELEINEGVSEGAFRDLAAVEKHRKQALKDLVACQKHIEKLEAKRKRKAKKKGGRK